jgi:hypothetical protein
MQSSGILRTVALLRTDVSEEHIVSIIRVTRIGELGTTLAVNTNLTTLLRNIDYMEGISALERTLAVTSN